MQRFLIEKRQRKEHAATWGDWQAIEYKEFQVDILEHVRNLAWSVAATKRPKAQTVALGVEVAEVEQVAMLLPLMVMDILLSRQFEIRDETGLLTVEYRII